MFPTFLYDNFMKKYRIRLIISTLIIMIMFGTLFIYSIVDVYKNENKIYIFDVEVSKSVMCVLNFMHYLINFWYIFFGISLVALLIMINPLKKLKKFN